MSRRADAAIIERDRLELIGGLRRLRRLHHVSEDCWYSCPKSSEGCCNDVYDEDECTCGADAHNALVDDLLSILGPVENGRQNPLTHVGREGPEQQVRFEDDGHGNEARP